MPQNLELLTKGDRLELLDELAFTRSMAKSSLLLWWWHTLKSQPKRFLATQSAIAHYQHSEVGYNYRLSNVLAGLGGQLRVLERRVAARRRNFEVYQQALENLPGIEFMPEASFGRARWLTCRQSTPAAFGVRSENRCA